MYVSVRVRVYVSIRKMLSKQTRLMYWLKIEANENE